MPMIGFEEPRAAGRSLPLPCEAYRCWTRRRRVSFQGKKDPLRGHAEAGLQDMAPAAFRRTSIRSWARGEMTGSPSAMGPWTSVSREGPLFAVRSDGHGNAGSPSRVYRESGLHLKTGSAGVQHPATALIGMMAPWIAGRSDGLVAEAQAPLHAPDAGVGLVSRRCWLHGAGDLIIRRLSATRSGGDPECSVRQQARHLNCCRMPSSRTLHSS